MEKKIFLEKNDGLEVAVEHLIHAKSDTVILNIPKESVLGRSVNNFHVLKREGNTAGKGLMVESVDDHILELASLATITAVNPVFQKKERAVSDILPRASVLLKKKQPVLDGFKKEKTESAFENSFSEKKRKDFVSYDADRDIENERAPHSDERTSGKPKKHKHKKNSIVRVLVIITFLFGLFLYLGFFVFPRATVVVTLKQKSVPFTQTVLVSQNNTQSEIKDSKIFLRGQLLVSQGNISLPISGAEIKNEDPTYATGVITIVNEYGTNSQKLVATTRFETPDGKIFRLRSAVTIPGGKLVGGTLKPGTIDADVIADKSGESYNIGPIERFSIPGFKGTPRFEKFYGFSKKEMIGGSSGISLSSTTNSEGDTEASIIEKLQAALETKMQILDSAKLTIPDAAKLFTVTKKDFQITSSSSMLYVEGTLKEIGFSESDLQKILGDYLKKDIGDSMRVRSIDLSYGTSTPNFSNGALSMGIEGAVLFESDVNIDMLKDSVLGKNANEMRGYMLSVPGVESTRVTFNLPWVTTIPSSSDRVEFIVE